MKLLTIDSNPGVQRLLTEHAGANGWQMRTTSSLKGAFEILGFFIPELILLDRQACDFGGRHFILELRAHTQAPLILLVEREKLAHLNGEMLLECEDFLCKPILADELKTRIQAVLWRNGDGQLKYGAIVLDQRSKQVSIADAPIQLTPKEYQLLMLLIKAQGRVLCNQEIIERAWAGSGRATASDVQQYIHHLRRKMKTHIGADHCISNDKGFGYHLNCQECPDPCGDKSVDQGADAAGDGHTPTPRRRASDLGTTGSNSRRSWLVSC